MKSKSDSNNTAGAVAQERLVRPLFDLTDEELFEGIREQVNKSRISGNHERLKTRQLAHEANQRGWNLKTNV
jgi:hypothetical protein